MLRRQTAEPFSRHTGLVPAVDPALAEQHLGRFSGMTYREAQEDPAYESDVRKRWLWQPDGGGESYADVAERVKGFFKKMETAVPAGNEDHSGFLIVTHAVTMRLIRGLLEDTLPDYPVPIANIGEIWKVDFESTGKIHRIESFFYGNSRNMVHQP